MQTYGVSQAGPVAPSVMAAQMQNSLDSLLSGNLGSSRPSYATAGCIWRKSVNSTTVEEYLFDGVSDIYLRTYNPTAHTLSAIAIPDGNVTASKIANGAINSAAKISDAIITFAKLAAAAIADEAAARAGVATDLLMTPERVAQAIDELTDSGVPSGAMMFWPGASTPTGWLQCYGQAISRSTYAGIFAALGTTHGTGNGSTTFNLPDGRDVVFVGKGDMGGAARGLLTVAGSGMDSDVLGFQGGAEAVTDTTAEMPSHGHTVNGYGTTGSSGNPAKTPSNGAGSPSSWFTTASQGGGGARRNVQPSLVLNVIIKI